MFVWFSWIFPSKNHPKTLPKRGPNPSKIDAENVSIFNIDFLRFWPRFGRVLGLQDGANFRFWALLGPTKPVLGRSWAPSKRVLDALRRLFAASWLTWAPPGLIWVGFRSLWASILKGFVGQFLRYALITAMTTLLHVPPLLFLPFRCGGLCAAHGI